MRIDEGLKHAAEELDSIIRQSGVKVVEITVPAVTPYEVRDDRTPSTAVVPYLRVTLLQAHPYTGERLYCVMQKMEKDGEYAGWKHMTNGYKTKRSAYAALGRLIQEHLGEN